MKRIIVLSGLVTSVVWVALTAIAVIFAFPAGVDAQAASITAAGLTLVRHNNLSRV